MIPHMTRRDLVTRASAVTGGAAAGLTFAAFGATGEARAQTAGGPEALSFDRLFSTSTADTGLHGEAADRVALRKLIDAWGHFADRRMAEEQAALMTGTGIVTVYDGEPDGRDPLITRTGRAELREALDGLNRFSHTTHFNGQSALSVDGDRAIGETYCMAHHLFEEDGARKLQVMAIRYYDDFLREGDTWRFAKRVLIIDWSETRKSEA